MLSTRHVIAAADFNAVRPPPTSTPQGLNESLCSNDSTCSSIIATADMSIDFDLESALCRCLRRCHSDEFDQTSTHDATSSVKILQNILENQPLPRRTPGSVTASTYRTCQDSSHDQISTVYVPGYPRQDGFLPPSRSDAGLDASHHNSFRITATSHTHAGSTSNLVSPPSVTTRHGLVGYGQEACRKVCDGEGPSLPLLGFGREHRTVIAGDDGIFRQTEAQRQAGIVQESMVSPQQSPLANPMPLHRPSGGDSALPGSLSTPAAALVQEYEAQERQIKEKINNLQHAQKVCRSSTSQVPRRLLRSKQHSHCTAALAEVATHNKASRVTSKPQPAGRRNKANLALQRLPGLVATHPADYGTPAENHVKEDGPLPLTRKRKCSALADSLLEATKPGGQKCCAPDYLGPRDSKQPRTERNAFHVGSVGAHKAESVRAGELKFSVMKTPVVGQTGEVDANLTLAPPVLEQSHREWPRSSTAEENILGHKRMCKAPKAKKVSVLSPDMIGTSKHPGMLLQSTPSINRKRLPSLQMAVLENGKLQRPVRPSWQAYTDPMHQIADYPLKPDRSITGYGPEKARLEAGVVLSMVPMAHLPFGCAVEIVSSYASQPT